MGIPVDGDKLPKIGRRGPHNTGTDRRIARFELQWTLPLTPFERRYLVRHQQRTCKLAERLEAVKLDLR